MCSLSARCRPMPVGADSTTNADSDGMCNPQVYVLLFCYYYWGWGVRMWCNGLIQSSAIAAHECFQHVFDRSPAAPPPPFFFPSKLCLFAALPLCLFALNGGLAISFSTHKVRGWLHRGSHCKFFHVNDAGVCGLHGRHWTWGSTERGRYAAHSERQALSIVTLKRIIL